MEVNYDVFRYGRFFTTMTPDTPHTISDPLREKAQTMPEGIAVRTPDRTFTYAELDGVVSATARQIQRVCPAAETRVGLYLPRGWQAIVLILATIRAGHVACPISTRTPAQGVATLLQTVSAPLLLIDDHALAGVLPTSVRVVMQEACLEEETGELGRFPDRVSSAPATIVFTSGSTGASKAALHSLGNHYYSAAGANKNISVWPGDRWLLALPLYHVGGLGIVFRCILAGAMIVIAEPHRSLGTVIAREGITHVSLVATQLARLLDENEGEAPSSLKAVLVGGSALSLSLVQEAYHRGYPLYTTYGLTEMTSQVTTTPPEASCDLLATSGRVLPYRHVSIAEEGEILVRGETLFQGYLDGDRLQKPFDSEGWFHTGDRGVLEADRTLRVLGRIDTMFISGGENMYPEEIEQWLCTLDGVVQAVVVPLADEIYGQRPVAFVQVQGCFPTPVDFETHLVAALPRFKIPDAFYPWPTDAPSKGMKVDRMFFVRYARHLHRAEK